VDGPLADLGAQTGVSFSELEGLANWATGRLRPDITVLLDRDPSALGGVTAPRGISELEHSWRVHKILTEMAAADPDRYVVVDADGSREQVAERVRAALAPLLPQVRPHRSGPGVPGMPDGRARQGVAGAPDDGTRQAGGAPVWQAGNPEPTEVEAR
jgi:hypothetical protein